MPLSVIKNSASHPGGKKYLKVAYNGGIVQAYDNAKKKDFKRDSVYTLLEPSEIVIPQRYSELILKYLKRKHIRFGNIK